MKRLREHLLVDVAREDLERGALEIAALLEQDRDRVRLLPRGTAGAPDADLLHALAREDLRHDLLDECGELRRLAEEVRLIRRDEVVDLVELGVGTGVVLEEVEVLLERVEVQFLRARRQPFLQQVLRRVVEPHPRPFVDLISHQPEDVVRQIEMMVQGQAEGRHELEG